jgi:hypothetical protein
MPLPSAGFLNMEVVCSSITIPSYYIKWCHNTGHSFLAFGIDRRLWNRASRAWRRLVPWFFWYGVIVLECFVCYCNSTEEIFFSSINTTLCTYCSSWQHVSAFRDGHHQASNLFRTCRLIKIMQNLYFIPFVTWNLISCVLWHYIHMTVKAFP